VREIPHGNDVSSVATTRGNGCLFALCVLHPEPFKRSPYIADSDLVVMKKFRFKLAAVQRLRQQEEEMVQAELAAAMRQESEINDVLEAHRAAEQDLYAYVRQGNLAAHELEHIAKYGHLHRQRIIDAQVELHRHMQSTQRIRARLTEARQRREVIDRLETKHRAAHREELEHEWARDLDDIATVRHARKRMHQHSAGNVSAGGAA
jgi:flagellar export protein FliJ